MEEGQQLADGGRPWQRLSGEVGMASAELLAGGGQRQRWGRSSDGEGGARKEGPAVGGEGRWRWWEKAAGARWIGRKWGSCKGRGRRMGIEREKRGSGARQALASFLAAQEGKREGEGKDQERLGLASERETGLRMG